MNRRNFLKAMIAAASAPAIVKADNIMKVWVPPEKKIALLTLEEWAKAMGLSPVEDIVAISNETNEISQDMQFKRTVLARQILDNIYLSSPHTQRSYEELT